MNDSYEAQDVDLVEIGVAALRQYWGSGLTYDRTFHGDIRIVLAAVTPLIERRMLESLVKDGSALASDCMIQREMGIGAVVMQRIERFRADIDDAALDPERG